ncbi:uncharacterized protein LOC123513327 isoform X2 [Portunus trituberculatus]|uniref:uncharacterized protein LOC123513327 isoform X2 n=1 Tax=Portunus trituberculatus TaxID=210409 RepID=UPI001E1D1521|nr:uncharacterized protein LOC123513327 isoform X2 [Portunus trituberculatus]
MAETSRPRWRNLQICEVEDAATIWVREVPSHACSEELQQFLEMEKQMNYYFNNRQLYNYQHASHITIGHPVVVCYKDCWRRGKVEKLPEAKGEKTSVFLVDYGFMCQTSLVALIPLNEGEWTSVPCQARKVVLHGVLPISLQRCKHWDASATDYVELLSSKKPCVEFTPLRFSQEGYSHGKMRIILPEETWMPILPKISHDKLIQTEDGKMALDLAQLLADCQFAQLFYETEKECGGTHLNIRNTSVSAETDSIKNVDTAVARQVPGTVGSGSDLCVTEGTSSNHNKLLDSDHRVRAGNIEGFDQCDSDVKYSSSILTYDPQSLHTRIDTEEKFKLNYSNNSGHSSFTEVTNPLFKRLSAKHTTLAGDEVLSSLRTNPESHSLILRKKESIELLKNEVCTVLEVQKQFKPDLSIDDKENLDCEQAVEYKDGKEAPLPERFEVCVSAKDVPLSSLRHRFSNIPCWASRSLVGVMHHPVNAKNEQNIYKKNSLEFDEQPPFKAGSTPSSRRSEIRKEILKASIQPKNTEPLNAAISIEETKPACDAFFMVNSCDTLTKYCTCDLDEIYKNVIKQDSLHSTTNIVKICRVFMAGESPVLEEEVMTSKVIMSATLNPHILSVLSERGMNATRLQAYTWPSINRGCSAVIVGEKLSGKTMGFVVPLLSLILDTYEHMSRRLSPGIGPVVVVVCSSWQSAKCAAEYVVSLLPANSTLKVMTAWGGCGTEEEISTGKQLLGGCDVLLTTAPCLMRLLTGESTVWSRGGGTEGATTSLRRCCHLVFDDADVVLEHFSLEVKEIITMWGNERKACGRADLQLQVVVVSSRWTKLLGQLTDVLLPLLDPTVIISTPFEAAIAAKVKNHCHWVDDETESLSLVMNFIAAASSQKSLVFVKDDDVAALLNSMMKNIAVYCLVVDSMIHKSRLKECIDEWHVMQGITMIVSEPAEKGLLQCDISDAQAIFHTHVGLSWNTFALRYGFMIDRFVFDVEEKSFCESYIILPKTSIERSPKIWGELNRICSNAAEKMKMHLLSTENGHPKDNSCLCCHLKACGSCFDESFCRLKHDISLCDQARDVPQTGKVTIEVVSVVNASRYFVRLTEYQAKSDGQRIDLSNHYHILRSALQQHYADPAHCKPVQVARKGMLCALQDKSVWSRGQVVSVNYSKATCQVNVFLIDEGREMIIELSSACVLPPYFASVPKLIVEVFLCCIQPKDNDREWTSQANSFVEEIFARNKKSKFVGTIVLALGYTLWLNPLIELSTIGNICAQKKSLRGKLLTERYGMDNPNHIKNLEQLCMMAGVSMRDEDTLSLCWIEARNEALQILSTVINREGLNSNILTNGKMETGETANENKEVCSNSVVHHKDSVNMTPLANVAKDHLPSASPGKTEAWPDLSYNRLPLNTEVTVEVTELVSAKEFYVVQQDKLQELDNLEDEINKLHDYLESCEGERQSGGGIVAAKPAIDSLCIAKFTDNKYYRGKVKAAESDGIVSVFFVDHGETIKVPQQQIHACTRAWVEYMPAQAIRCTLAHLTIPPYLNEPAMQTMTHLMDLTDSWKVKALEVKDDGGLLHVVELTENAGDTPLEVWKHLVHQGVAFMDSEDVSNGDDQTSELFITADLDDEELTKFFFGITDVKQLDTKKKEIHFRHNETTVHPDEKESNPSCISKVCESDLVQENAPKVSERKGKESKNNVASDKTLSGKSVDPVNQHMKNKYTKEEYSNMKTNLEEQPSCKEVKESLNLKEKDQDIHRRHTSESQVLNMKRLGMPPLSAVDGVTQRLAPDTTWSQKDDTVNISIHLIGVEQYKCHVSSTHLIFMSVLGDKFYVVDEELCQKVVTQSCVVNVQGISVSITLKKAVKEKWMSLFKDRRHRPWLRVQYENLSLEEDSSETEDYDDDGWRKVMTHSKEAAATGGLAGGISSDTESSTDTELF